MNVAFSVADFHDLVQLLRERPDWQAELRALVLTEELLHLPAVVQRLAEAQERTEGHLERLSQRMDALAAGQEVLTQQVAGLAEAQRRNEDHFARLTEQLTEIARALSRLTDDQAWTRMRLDRAMGDLLEIRYERRAAAYFARLARRIRVIGTSDLAVLLDDAVRAGQLEDWERDAVLLADLVLSGRRREDDADVYLVVEVSETVHVDDVDRAADRAAALAKLGRTVLPVVAGEGIDPHGIARAQARGVSQVLDGRTVEPPPAPAA